MGLFDNNNNNFNTNYRKRPNDTYKAALEKLPEEEKRRLDRQRSMIMTVVVVFVLGLIIILAATGIGVDETNSGNIFISSDTVDIAFFGDSITEGYTLDENGESYIVETTYADAAKEILEKLYPDVQINIYNYGISGDIGENTSYKRVEEDVDVALVLYMLNNFIYDEEYEGILEANVTGLEAAGASVVLVNYPVCDGGEYEDEVEACNEYIAQVAESEEIVLIDADDYFEAAVSNGTYTLDELFSSDGLHLSETGYQFLGEIVADVLETYEND